MPVNAPAPGMRVAGAPAVRPRRWPVRRFRHGQAGPAEIARGVFRLSVRGANVYFVRSGPGWVLVDAGWRGQAEQIARVAGQAFGQGVGPAAVLVTHAHADHAGSALELARRWEVPLWVHPGEMPMTDGIYHPQYADPIARWTIEPLMRLMPGRAARWVAKSGLGGAARAFDPDHAPPGMADWAAVPTPGHTPGHVAFFRPDDRVLIAGDAVLTLNFNSVPDLILARQQAAAPPRISTWDWPKAARSVAVLAELCPRVLACGHGSPMSGPGTAGALRDLARRLAARGPASGSVQDGLQRR